MVLILEHTLPAPRSLAVPTPPRHKAMLPTASYTYMSESPGGGLCVLSTALKTQGAKKHKQPGRQGPLMMAFTPARLPRSNAGSHALDITTVFDDWGQLQLCKG